MTALEITTDGDGACEHLDAAPPVRWEPCTVFAEADTDACTTCGWLADEHPSFADDAGPAGAVVMALPMRSTLRRAS